MPENRLFENGLSMGCKYRNPAQLNSHKYSHIYANCHKHIYIQSLTFKK